ncbi:MAG: hypothetical protein H6Q13_2947 [Bacteroidetes bacterium]|nr:hypothetical protein [Bacteroidota bacterium]
MKALFLIFHGFEEFNGISKKIRYQVKALQECGLDVRTCYLSEENGHKRRMIDKEVLEDYGSGFKSKILKRIEFGSIINYVKEQKVEFIYIRYDHNSNPFTINLMKRLHACETKIVIEIPTYPYDLEYKNLPLPYQRILLIDKCFREKFANYAHRIVTFSNHKVIWKRPTIRISNGVDFDNIKLKQNINDTTHELRLIGVATIHPWHGFDRVIAGLVKYYTQEKKYKVNFHIIGYGVPEIIESYKKNIEEHNLQTHVFFHEGSFGEELDDQFNKADMGIGSLARHRSGITNIKTLKNREYAARGIPFVYSETDDDFEQMPYILKVSADETPIDIEKLIAFYHAVKWTPLEIRNSIINNLSWKKQMQKVIDETFPSNP